MLLIQELIYKALVEYEEVHRNELTDEEKHTLNVGIEDSINADFGWALLTENGYFGIKMWCEDDIKQVLLEEGYKSSQENVSYVMSEGLARSLANCTDEDWDKVEYCIWEAAQKGNLVKENDEQK